MMIVGGCHRTILDLCSYRASNVNLVGITFHNVLLSLNVIGSPSLSVIQVAADHLVGLPRAGSRRRPPSRCALPLITLHHFTNPRWLEAMGGWLHPGTPHRFARFAAYAVAWGTCPAWPEGIV